LGVGRPARSGVNKRNVYQKRNKKMETSKKWYESKTVWASLISFAAIVLMQILPMFGVKGMETAGQVLTDEGSVIADHLVAIAGAVAAIIAVWGRITAKSTIEGGDK